MNTTTNQLLACWKFHKFFPILSIEVAYFLHRKKQRKSWTLSWEIQNEVHRPKDNWDIRWSNLDSYNWVWSQGSHKSDTAQWTVSKTEYHRQFLSGSCPSGSMLLCQNQSLSYEQWSGLPQSLEQMCLQQLEKLRPEFNFTNHFEQPFEKLSIFNLK